MVARRSVFVLKSFTTRVCPTQTGKMPAAVRCGEKWFRLTASKSQPLHLTMASTAGQGLRLSRFYRLATHRSSEGTTEPMLRPPIGDSITCD